MKPRSRRGYCMTDRDTCEVIQNVGNGEIVVRIIKARYTYTSDTPQMRIYENDRQFVRMDAEGKIHVENYYYSNGDGILTHWKAGEYPQFSQWQYSFEADTCGHLYCKNLPAALKDTPWQYCPVNDFYNYYYERMQVLPFLHAFQKHPRLEHLVKTGFCDIVSDLVYRYTPNCLDETQNRTHRILRVAAEDIPFLQELNTNLSLLHTFQGYAGMKERKRLLLWQMENKVERDILPILNYITVHKFIRYVDSQHGFLCLRKTPDGMLRYKKLQDVVSEYRDYLEMCHKLDYDMKNSFVLYPKDLQKSHDKVARRMKHKKDAELKQKFVSVYRQLSGQLEFETDGLKIIYPDTPDDVIKEGNALHHCVGSYVKRVADGECVILFLRKSAEVSKAFYTIEVRGQSVVQVRGKGNCSMTPEVEAFMEEWKRKVLCAPLSVAAA